MIFQLAKTQSGYGMCWDGKGKMSLAHRIYYEAEHGPIADGLQVDHLCGKKACMNAFHLEVVTQQEHLRRHGKLKLSDDQVRAIRTDARPQKLIALEFGTTQSNVSRIKSRLSRRCVPGEELPQENGPEK